MTFWGEARTIVVVVANEIKALIAAEAEMSPGLIYRYYPGKIDIMVAACLQAVQGGVPRATVSSSALASCST